MKNKKKVTLLGVAFIAAVITLAGVGYAVVSHPGYQGSVSTDANNSYDVDYVVVKFDGNSAFTPKANFKLTWDTETAYVNEAQQVTYDWKASDTLVHALIITATDPGVDTYTLKATVTDPASGYKLYYKLTQDDGPVTSSDVAAWTLYTGNAQANLKTGYTVTPAAIGSQQANYTISWVVIPDPDQIVQGQAEPPVTSVAITGISYTVEAVQSQQ